MSPISRARIRFAILLLVLLVGGFAIWKSTIRDAPFPLNIPQPPAMPQPNALDYYLKAYTQMNPMDARGVIAEQLWDSTTPEKSTLMEKEKALADTRQALATIRQGFNYPYLASADRSLSHMHPEYSRMRELAHYLRFAARTKAAQGDWSGAVTCDLDALRLGSDVPQHAVLIGALVGDAIQALGRDNSWVTCTHLTAAQARDAGARMTQIVARSTNLADTMQEEKWAVLSGLQEIFKRADWRKQLADELADEGTNKTRLKIQLYFTSEHDVLAGYRDYMDHLIHEARKPYAQRKDVPLPADRILRFLCSVYQRADKIFAINDTENVLLLTSFALQAYREEHGVYPLTLAELMPGYLTTIPLDPFSPAATLRYKLTPASQKGSPEKYLLYSIGPDGKDDGGRPVEDKSAKESYRYNVSSSNRDGDIVAGVNLN